MSNFAEFDVPEPAGQAENNSQQETTKEPTVETKPKTNKTKPAPSKRKTSTNTFSFLLTIIGLLALFPVAFKTVTLWFKIDLTYPLQAELASYTIILLIVSFVCLKLSGRNPLAKLGLAIFYLTTAGWIAYKVYNFVTTGVFTWS